MSDDRLKDLQRQRELAREQQEQLDREIAREMAQGQAAQPTGPATAPVLPAQPLPANPALDADADAILRQYRTDQPVKDTVRKGCLIYFFAAFALVGIGLALLYLFHH
jgi:hypothetical protein